jgi:cell division protein FtsW
LLLEPCGEAGFQLSQALLGFGAGPFRGRLAGQLKLHYLPYAYSDFLFSTIGEEWGFLGVLVIVSLFGLLLADFASRGRRRMPSGSISRLASRPPSPLPRCSTCA